MMYLRKVNLLVMVVVASFSANAAYSASPCPPKEELVTFTTSDGVTLHGEVISPCGSSPSDSFPTVFFLNPFGQSFKTYKPQALAFAEDGYRTFSYDPRGWQSSGGKISLDYELLTNDVRQAIDWVTGHYKTGRIGVTGISEGGGLSMLLSAIEPRLSAVAALSGWTNMVHPALGHTQRLAWNIVLGTLITLFGKPSAIIEEAFEHWRDGTPPEPRELMEKTSPLYHLKEINERRPPIFLANDLDDTLFPVNQAFDFYGKLQGPKHLQINRGFHAAAAITTTKEPNKEPWASVHKWFDAYVKNGQPSELDGLVRVNYKNQQGILEFRDNALREPKISTYYLKQTNDGYELSQTAEESRLDADLSVVSYPWNPSGIISGIPLKSALENLRDLKTVSVPLRHLKRPYAIAFTAKPVTTDTTVYGVATLQLSLKSKAKKGLVVAYLVDVDANGDGKLMTHGVYTWSESDALADGHFSFKIELYHTAWKLAAGHKLAIALNSSDPEYQPPTLLLYDYNLDDTEGSLRLDVPSFTGAVN
ncbi:MAG: alpha/beta hydrolase [Proteobacteria bacterium]|nr:alpha/beta hydrolase [Pseudomonadota bacterium]